MGYRTLLRDHRGLLGIAFLALFTSSLGQSFFTSLLVRLWGAEHLGTVRATLSACMVFSTGIAPAILGVALDLGADFSLVLGGMLAFLVIGWTLAQGVLASPEAKGP